MSDRFTVSGTSINLGETFQLADLPQVDVEKFDAIERAAVERVITEQQTSLIQLQTDVLEVQTERDALSNQLSTVVDDRDRLQERVQELEAQRPALEPKTVFQSLGTALEAADESLSSERYRVDDVDFTLKANVTQTEDGVQMYLPSVDESSLSTNLSEISFKLRAPRTTADRPEASYVEVPELSGLSREAAVRRLNVANFSLGSVESVSDPTTTPGAVVEQFPEAFAVAEPGASVDLVLAAEPEPPSDPETDAEDEPPSDADAEGEEPVDTTDDGTPSEPATETDDATSEADDAPTETDEETRTDGLEGSEAERMEAFRRAIVTAYPDAGPAVVDRLRRAGVTDIESLVELDAEKLADELSIPVEHILTLQEKLGGSEEQMDLESINGIGPTYADRLRDKGIESVAELAELDPEEAAEITRASTSRTADWIEEARAAVKR